MAGFKAAQLGHSAADTVLDTLDLVTRCEGHCFGPWSGWVAARSADCGVFGAPVVVARSCIAPAVQATIVLFYALAVLAR